MSVPDKLLIDAARHYARRTAGQAVRRITLTLADGSKRKIDVPLVTVEDHDDDFPPAEGWGYRGDEFACGGEIFHVAGKPAKVLQVLIDADGQWVPLGDLKVAVWDKWADKRTVQNSVSRLRQAIRVSLGVAESIEVIDATEDGYRLSNFAVNQNRRAG